MTGQGDRGYEELFSGVEVTPPTRCAASEERRYILTFVIGAKGSNDDRPQAPSRASKRCRPRNMDMRPSPRGSGRSDHLLGRKTQVPSKSGAVVANNETATP